MATPEEVGPHTRLMDAMPRACAERRHCMKHREEMTSTITIQFVMELVAFSIGTVLSSGQ